MDDIGNILYVDCDSTQASQAICSLKELAERLPEIVKRFFEACESISDIIKIDSSDYSASTRQLRLVLEPSDRLRDFLAACAAGNVDGH